MEIKEVTVQQLKAKIDANEPFQLIDVREEYEFDICNIKGELVPLATIPQFASKISKEIPVIVHCRSGARSARAIEYLQDNGGFTNLFNLKGGIIAWAEEIEPEMAKY